MAFLPSVAFSFVAVPALNPDNHAILPTMSAIPVVRVLFLSGFFFAVLIGELHSGPAVTEPLVELPKLTVTDVRRLPPPEPWRYAQVPGLEIISAVSDRETQKLLRDFQLFTEAITVVWPALKTHRPVPMTLILFEKSEKFAAFVPATADTSFVSRASLLMQSSDQAAIVLNFGNKIIDLKSSDAETGPPVSPGSPSAPGVDPSAGPVGSGGEVVNRQIDFYRQLYREYVRYQLSFNQPRLPAWLEEGLAQLLMSMKVDPKFIEFAKVEDPNLASIPGVPDLEEHDFNKTLAYRGLIPLPEFFAVGLDSPEANNPLTGTWAKQAQALVHLWLYGEGKRYNKGFAQFVARSTREPVTEAMFQECFKMSYKEMLTALRIYLGNTAYVHQEFNAKKDGGLPEPAPLALRDATEAEVGRIKGEAQVLAGHPELAHDEMLAPYARGVTDGALLASLGLLEKTRGETVRARKFLEAAVQAQVVRPRAYLELANLRLAQISTSGSLLTANQTQMVLQPLLVARQQPPVMPEIYEPMAEIWLRSETPPSAQDLALLNQGVVHFQLRPVLLLRAAELNAKYGDPNAARMMADFGVKLSKTTEARQAFEEVLATLPPLPAK